MNSVESARLNSTKQPPMGGTSSSKQHQLPCPNCKNPLKFIGNIDAKTFECANCGKKYMCQNPATGTGTTSTASTMGSSESKSKQLTTSQEANKPAAATTQSAPPVRRSLRQAKSQEPEIIAIDDTDEELETDTKQQTKRKTEADWEHLHRLKQPKNDENEPTKEASAADKELKKADENVQQQQQQQHVKLGTISANLSPFRNGKNAKGVTREALELLYRDWGVRESDLADLPTSKAKSSSRHVQMNVRYLGISSYVNTDPETHLLLSDASGLTMKITHDSYQISIILGTDDLQYCCLAFYDPIYLFMLKVTKKFADLFHHNLSQLSQVKRHESETNDTRFVILLNIKKPEAAECWTYLCSFLYHLFLGDIGFPDPSRVFRLSPEKTFEFVQKLFPSSEIPEIKRFYKRYGSLVAGNPLLKYPTPERSDASTVTFGDLMCLEDGEFLNDNIISFYLKYLQTEVLSAADKQRIHIFDTFFYQRLTQKSQKTKSEAGLSAAERRHSRVRKWTRNVNIFEKDFLIVPINKNAHWYLAIICYPYLKEPVFRDRTEPVKEESAADSPPADNEEEAGSDTGQKRDVSKRRTASRNVDASVDYESSDEADPQNEGAASDLESLKIDKDKICTKLPVILIFDSLPNSKHLRVIATLREYMECEYNARFGKPYDVHLYGSKAATPTQNNFFDCGIYLLQYVESFFTNPLENFGFPINLRSWFPRKVIEDKRLKIKRILFAIHESQSRGSTVSASSERARSGLNLLKDLKDL